MTIAFCLITAAFLAMALNWLVVYRTNRRLMRLLFHLRCPLCSFEFQRVLGKKEH
jgi:hypothetical protein